WRLERPAPVQLAVGTVLKLPRPAEMEIRMPRLTDRPAAVMLLKVEQFLRACRLLGLGLRCHDILRTVESLAGRRWEFRPRMTSPLWGRARTAAMSMRLAVETHPF